MPSPKDKSDPITIKKYANRRLYNTDSSSYITLEHIGAMVREGRDFKVLDARTGEDITRSVLTQIIMEEENRGQTMLPIPFLRQLISLYGDSMQSLVPHYLEASMDALRRNQEQFRDALGTFGSPTFKPFEAFARQNLAMIQAAAEILARGPAGGAGSEGAGDASEAGKEASGEAPSEPKPAEPPEPGDGPVARSDEELKRLREQMMALQAQLERLEKR
jgi:polyhydroxyalkanoate synthesis repressor PhaR